MYLRHFLPLKKCRYSVRTHDSDDFNSLLKYKYFSGSEIQAGAAENGAMKNAVKLLQAAPSREHQIMSRYPDLSSGEPGSARLGVRSDAAGGRG